MPVRPIGGGGDAQDWSQYNAIQNVSMVGFGFSNLGFTYQNSVNIVAEGAITATATTITDGSVTEPTVPVLYIDCNGSDRLLTLDATLQTPNRRFQISNIGALNVINIQNTISNPVGTPVAPGISFYITWDDVPGVWRVV